MSQILFPDPPLTAGQSFNAPNGVTYTWDDTIGTGVWKASATAPTPTLTVTNPGTISGTAEVGATLTYTTGTATGGTGAIGYTWQWFITPSTPIGAIGTQGTITVPAGALNKNIYVKLIATDSATPTANTATADTANFPSSGTIAAAGISGAAAPTTIPGTASFPWTDASGNLTASGCIEFSVDGGGTWWQTPQPVVSGTTTVQTRWLNVASSGQCGDIPGNGNITGTLTASTGETTTFTFNVNRTPSAFTLSSTTETTTPNTVTSTNPSFTLAGSNSPSYIWGAVTGGGGTPEYSVSGTGGPWLAMPSAPGTAKVNPGATVHIRFTTGSTLVNNVLTVNVGASTTAGQFQSGAFTVTVAAAPFPATSFSPGGAPNASPVTVSIPADSLYGKASATWGAGTTNLTSTGGIQFQVNGGGYGTSYTGINDLDTIDVIWDPGVISGAADNAVLNGTLTNGVYTNTFTITVTRAVTPASFSFVDVDPVVLSSTNTSATVTPTGFNVPVTLSIAGATTNPMTTPLSQVGTGGFSATAKTVNPGDGIQLQGTAGGTISTDYGITATIGSAPISDTWLTKTAPATPTVTQPTISTPTTSQTGVGTASGLTITSSAYSGSPSLAAVGAHDSSDWELYANSYPLGPSTGTVGVVTAGTAGTPTAVSYKDSNTANPNAAIAQNVIYGKTAQDNALSGAGTYSGFAWADALSINGYNDWYIPANNEIEILYYNLKPSTTPNQTAGIAAGGINPNAVPPRGSVYTSGSPAQTGVSLFRVGGAEAFDSTSGVYMSSTEDSGSPGTSFYKSFDTGGYSTNNKTANFLARAIRRIPVAEYTAAGSPAIGTYLKGGYYGGQISTAGNGTADYALIVAPNAQGTYGYTGGTNASFTINGADTDGFTVGMQIKGSPSNAVGIILSINSTSIQYLPVSGTFATGDTISTDPASYTLADSTTNDTINLVSWPVAKPPLTAFTKYYTRVRYNSVSNPPVYTSAWSPWREFTTGALAPAGIATLLATNTGCNIARGSRIGYDGSIYAFAGSTATAPGKSFTSTNLTSWSPSGIGSSVQNAQGKLAWTGTRWLAVAYSTAPTAAYYATSPSGAWTTAGFSIGGNYLSSLTVRDSSNIFAGGNTDWGLSTDGGLNYTTYGAPLEGGNAVVPYGGGTYFNGAYLIPGYGTNGVVARSTTGASGSWTFPLSVGTTATLYAVASSPTAAVAVGQPTAIRRSSDGITWTSTGSAATVAMIDVFYANGVFVAVGQNGNVWVSTDDGSTWSDKTATVNLPSVDFWGVSYVNGKWLMVSSLGSVYQLT